MTYATYVYDVFGNRIEKDVWSSTGGNSKTRYGYDNAEPPASAGGLANAWVDLNSSNALVTRYLRGDVIDQLYARISAAGTAAWYLPDHLGSIRNLTDNTGTLIDTIAYDAYGNITNESSPSNGDQYKWALLQLDPETGLMPAEERYYLPAIGRWLQQDPSGFGAGDWNLYRYTNNGPNNATDPSGMFAIDHIHSPNLNYFRPGINGNMELYLVYGPGSIPPWEDIPYQQALALDNILQMGNTPMGNPQALAAWGQHALVLLHNGYTLNEIIAALGPPPMPKGQPLPWYYWSRMYNMITGYGNGATFGLLQLLWGDAINPGTNDFQAGQNVSVVVGTALTFVCPCSMGAAASTGLRAVNAMHALGAFITAHDNWARGKYGWAIVDIASAIASMATMLRVCFAAGTPLLTPEGSKPIEEFRPGDWLLSAPEENPEGQPVARQVEGVLTNCAQLWEVHVGGQVIRTTAEHPF